jgi:hypothetical protein
MDYGYELVRDRVRPGGSWQIRRKGKVRELKVLVKLEDTV